ncbi:MAG: polysaccharide deacetylase family protein [Spirochaetaceae bacterium]
MRRFLIIQILLLCSLPLWGQVSFGQLRLSEDNTLLFSARAESPVFGSYKTLFEADLESGRKRPLTFFPEKIEYLEDSGKLQIQNRFGTYRTDSDFTKVEEVEGFPSFAQGEAVETGKIRTIGSSPDGMYMAYIEKKSHAYGELKLFFVDSGKEVTISRDVGLSYEEPAVSWAPDSGYFVYRKQGDIYYYSLDQLKRDEVVEESLRRIGRGSIRSVGWSGKSSLIYIKDSVVYEISGQEFFTRSFYRDLLDAGKVAGKIPFTFDSNFDDFHVSPDGKKILLNKGGRNLFFYFLSTDDYLSTGDVASLPYLHLPRNTRIKEILWSSLDLVTVLTGSIRGGEEDSELFRLSLFDDRTGELKDRITFESMDSEGVRHIVLSEDQEKAAVVRSGGVDVRRYSDWSRENTFSHPSPLHAVWKNNEELVIAGAYRTELVDTEDSKGKLIALSRAGEFGYSEDGSEGEEIYTRFDGEGYSYGEGAWSANGEKELKEPRVSSESYRVFIESTPPGVYQNSIMVRDISGYGTSALVEGPALNYEPFPEKDEPVNKRNFTHGSRIRRREVALVFNAIDSVEGLTEILTTLKDYNIRATFFVNGEFIRRNPEAAQEIASSDHETGSLFYSYFNMTDSRYRIDREFIKRGLARNEDEFFQVSGEELSLLWHAPYYFVNNEIIEASQEMNYTYIGRDVDTLDWVPKSDRGDGMYRQSRDLVERALEKKKPGSILPIRIGAVEKGREDYLFQFLDLLINGLISQGYEIVPVSTLIHHAN